MIPGLSEANICKQAGGNSFELGKDSTATGRC